MGVEFRLKEGRPDPLGATFGGQGVNFALFSAHAKKVELCLFEGPRESARLALPECTDDIWHGYLPGAQPGLVNPYEDFYHDDRLAELLRHYSDGPHPEMPVELVINGDFLDLLKLAIDGRFVTEVTEDIAVEKVRRCILGHPVVFDALAAFLARPNRKVTYVAGNHDMDIVFPRVQRMMRARLGVPRAWGSWIPWSENPDLHPSDEDLSVGTPDQ